MASPAKSSMAPVQFVYWPYERFLNPDSILSLARVTAYISEMRGQTVNQINFFFSAYMIRRDYLLPTKQSGHINKQLQFRVIIYE